MLRFHLVLIILRGFKVSKLQTSHGPFPSGRQNGVPIGGPLL
jgi:hypothetical protein